MSELTPSVRWVVTSTLQTLGGMMRAEVRKVLELTKQLCFDMEADKNRENKTLLEVQVLDAVEAAEVGKAKKRMELGERRARCDRFIGHFNPLAVDKLGPPDWMTAWSGYRGRYLDRHEDERAYLFVCFEYEGEPDEVEFMIPEVIFDPESSLEETVKRLVNIFRAAGCDLSEEVALDKLHRAQLF